MDTRKRSGRYKRLDTIRGERRKQKQRKRLATLLMIGGGVLLNRSSDRNPRSE